MNETYSRKEAMERLGLRSTNSFLFLERKYPEAFIIVNEVRAGDKQARYDKAALDNFVRNREYFMGLAGGERI